MDFGSVEKEEMTRFSKCLKMMVQDRETSSMTRRLQLWGVGKIVELYCDGERMGGLGAE